MQPLGRLAWMASAVSRPLMWVLTGPSESPQQTAKWNSWHLSGAERSTLKPGLGVPYEGDPTAGPGWRWGIPVFRIAIVRSLGWQRYIVVEPADPVDMWYTGVMWDGGSFFSHIPLRGPVRLLVGPGDAVAFGVDAEGQQIPLQLVGFGELGDGGPRRKLPLL